jgi:uncharacterized membrane protein YesL
MRFNIDGPVWQFITQCTRFLILNVLFVITIIPIVTIGPARTALYSTVFAYTDNEGIDLGREYLKRFKDEFLRSIASSLIFVALAAAIAFAIIFWYSSDTTLSNITLPVLIVATVVVVMTFEYHFPLQARYDNTFAGTWKNSLMLPWAAFTKTLALLAIDMAGIALFVFTGYLRVAFLLLGFAWLAYAKSLIYLKIFDQVSTDPHKKREAPDYTLPTASL